jgi:hypothetical protein
MKEEERKRESKEREKGIKTNELHDSTKESRATKKRKEKIGIVLGECYRGNRRGWCHGCHGSKKRRVTIEIVWHFPLRSLVSFLPPFLPSLVGRPCRRLSGPAAAAAARCMYKL